MTNSGHARPPAPPRIRHAFTVDVEDWYQGIPIDATDKRDAERRLERGLEPLLDMLDEAGAKGTFFILGPLVEHHPAILKRIADAGHEIGCHGWSHDLVYTLDPRRFRDETQRAVDAIARVTDQPVRAYRAAYFSITEESLWALDVLASLGFRYDSSIFPVKNWRYGIPDFPPRPQRMETPSGHIMELPMSVRRVLGRNVPVSGGAYFRLYPYALSRANMLAMEARRTPSVFYLHPWELDPDHPRVSFHWKAHLTHYVNLRSTTPRLKRLLREFEFAPLGQVLEEHLADVGQGS